MPVNAIYNVHYTFTNEYGNYVNSIDVELDNTASTPSIIQPNNNDEVGGLVEIKVHSDLDSEFTQFSYYYDENDNGIPDDGWNWNSINCVDWSIEEADLREFNVDWDTTILTNGKYIIMVETYDDTINVDQDNIQVTVNNP